jgi:hypothetical protein
VAFASSSSSFSGSVGETANGGSIPSQRLPDRRLCRPSDHFIRSTESHRSWNDSSARGACGCLLALRLSTLFVPDLGGESRKHRRFWCSAQHYQSTLPSHAATCASSCLYKAIVQPPPDHDDACHHQRLHPCRADVRATGKNLACVELVPLMAPTMGLTELTRRGICDITVHFLPAFDGTGIQVTCSCRRRFRPHAGSCTCRTPPGHHLQAQEAVQLLPLLVDRSLEKSIQHVNNVQIGVVHRCPRTRKSSSNTTARVQPWSEGN